jgi:hypothetical protein
MWLERRSTTLPEPFSWSPSQAFEGNDGSWSTFVVRIGEPDQDFHVLISTASQETWVPVIDGCLPTDPANCGALRGVLPFNSQYSGGFQVNMVISSYFISKLRLMVQSSTWNPISLYELGLEQNLNLTGNGEYGYDTVGLQLANSGGLTLKHQIVAGAYKSSSFLCNFQRFYG